MRPRSRVVNDGGWFSIGLSPPHRWPSGSVIGRAERAPLRRDQGGLRIGPLRSGVRPLGRLVEDVVERRDVSWVDAALRGTHRLLLPTTCVRVGLGDCDKVSLPPLAQTTSRRVEWYERSG